MANKIVLKKSAVQNKVPQPSDLDYGELALNYRDGWLYYKDHNNVIKKLNEPPPAGSGSGSDADLLDGIDSTEFLRSNVSDNYTNGTLTFDSGTTLTAAAGATVNYNNTGVSNLTATLSTGTAVVTVTSTTGLVAGQTLTKISGTGAFGATPTILSVDSATQFTASVDHDTAGAILFSAGTAPFAVVSSVKVENLNADLLDGKDYLFFYSPDNPPPPPGIEEEQDTLQTVTERNLTGLASLTATLSTGTAVVTVADTTGLATGQTLTKISGTGAFGTYAYVLTVDSGTQFTASVNHATSGSITFSAGRFSTTTQKIEILNTTQSDGNDGTITEGALIVRGGVGIEKDLHIKGDMHIVGTGTLRFGPYDVGATAGNLWWVRNGGLDLDPTQVNGAGEQLWTAFGSIKWALKYAGFGDTVLVQPGEYEEVFPMYVPKGVSLRGSGLRETQIFPTVGTNDKDAFLVSGDATISDFTVKNFFYNSTNDTGYAFRYSTYSATLTSGVATVTVADTTGLVAGQTLTKISGTGAFGASPTVLSVDSDTQFTVSVNHDTSGDVVFSIARTIERSTYIQRCTVITKGSVTSPSDPYGFAQGDAGRGALIDGALLSRSSQQAAILFNELTFIVPNSRGVIMTNGARAEFLTCFIYFADLAFEGKVGTTGRGMDGKTYITLSGKTGTWEAGNTLSLYDTDGTTVIASATIESVSGDRLTIDGSASGFVANTDRTPKTVTVFGNAQLDTAIKKIGSASLLLDGTGDYLKIDATSDFQFTGDFCAEAWIYPTSVTGTQNIFAFGTEASGRYVLFLDGNTIKGNYFGSGSTTFGGTLSTNTWYHVALSRAGSTMTVYLDGTALGTTETNNSTLGNSGELKIGADASGNNNFAGHFDELRITKGYRRYSGTFTPYTTARTGDADTVLLLHFDGADGSTTMVDDGSTSQDVRSSAGGTATEIIRYDRSEFAAELRSIASAFVYGNQGIKADGPDVLLQLMAHNFSYIGTGADLTNDKSAVIQDNEVIELNGGRVFFNSVDQAGNFRVGDNFLVDFQTGAVTFSGGTFDVNALGSITFTDGANTTTVQASGITTNNLSLAGNTISTTSGDLTLDPSGSADIFLNGDTTVTGLLTTTTLTHSGLVMSDGGNVGNNNVDQLVTITKSLTLTTDWQDTGIKSSDLATGTYIVQLYANDIAAGGTSSNEYYSGTMSWYAGNTDSSVSLPTDEIVLHRAGGSSDAGLYLRTFRTESADPDNLKLQIYSNLANPSASNYVFKFRRMI